MLLNHGYSCNVNLYNIGPVQTPMVTVNNSRFPNVSPYNIFQLSCIALLEVVVDVPLNFTWKRSTEEHCHNVDYFTNVVTQFVETEHQSNVTVVENHPSAYCYQCRVELGMEELGDTGASYNLTVNVTCK